MSAKIAAALHEIMSKVGYVQKTGKNAFHGYKYAGEADLLDKLRPAMVEAGLMLLPSVKSVSPIDDHGNVLVQMEYTLIHKDGEVWPEKIGAAGMGNDRAKNGAVGDKGVYKAITGANKYVLFKLFQIETGDDPEIASHHDNASDEPVERSPQSLGSAAAPKRVVGTNPKTGMRTAHSLKKETGPDTWGAFQEELLECQTVNALLKLAAAWSVICERDKWPHEWRELAKEEINKRRELILNGPREQSDFPGDPGYISTIQAG